MRINRSQIAFVLLLTGALIGCKSTVEQRFSIQAQQIRLRTLPTGGTASEPAVTLSGTVLSATWEIHSDLKHEALESWLPEALKPDFAKTNAAEDRIWFSKYGDGESDRLEVSFSPEVDGRTIAHVRLTVAPD